MQCRTFSSFPPSLDFFWDILDFEDAVNCTYFLCSSFENSLVYRKVLISLEIQNKTISYPMSICTVLYFGGSVAQFLLSVVLSVTLHVLFFIMLRYIFFFLVSSRILSWGHIKLAKCLVLLVRWFFDIWIWDCFSVVLN